MTHLFAILLGNQSYTGLAQTQKQLIICGTRQIHGGRTELALEPLIDHP